MLSPPVSPDMNAGAFKTAALTRHMNQDIQSCKGSGWLYIDTGIEKQTFRLAYAAKPPDRIRLTLLSSGHPVETVLADGGTVTFISHTGRHKTTTYHSKDPSLKDILSIPVRMSDIIRLLSGQIPLQDYNNAVFVSGGDGPPVIELTRNIFSVRQHLVTRPDGFPLLLRRLDSGKNHLFSIQFKTFTQFESRTVATSFSIQDDSSRSADIDITAFQADIPVNDAIFRLTESR